MPLITGLLIAGGSIIGGNLAAGGAEKAAQIQTEAAEEAARLQAEAAQKALEEQQRQFDIQQGYTERQWEAGAPSRNALARLGRIMSGEEEFDVTQLPGYQERFGQGLEAVTRAQAAGPGGRFGGRALKELTRYGQQFAGGERENYLNRLATMAGLRGEPVGPAMPNTAGTIMAGAGGQAQAIMQGGAAGAQGVLGSTQATNQAIQSGIGNYLAYQQQQNLMNMMKPQTVAAGA